MSARSSSADPLLHLVCLTLQCQTWAREHVFCSMCGQISITDTSLHIFLTGYFLPLSSSVRHVHAPHTNAARCRPMTMPPRWKAARTPRSPSRRQTSCVQSSGCAHWMSEKRYEFVCFFRVFMMGRGVFVSLCLCACVHDSCMCTYACISWCIIYVMCILGGEAWQQQGSDRLPANDRRQGGG